MLFFSALVLPTFFMNLPVHEAGSLAALLFPKYNLWGTVCALFAFVAAAYLWFCCGSPWRTLTFVSVLALVLQCYAAFGLHPQVASLRGRESAQAKARFDRLHHRSVRINGLLLLTELGLLVWCGRRIDAD